jgi:hypothetical protein
MRIRGIGAEPRSCGGVCSECGGATTEQQYHGIHNPFRRLIFLSFSIKDFNLFSMVIDLAHSSNKVKVYVNSTSCTNHTDLS